MKVDPVLSVRGLQVSFAGAEGPVPAVRGVDLDVWPDEVLGIVGESGSGKSVTALAIAGLLAGNAQVRGSVFVDGQDVVRASPDELRRLRAERIGFIFQDPTTTLNPLMTVGRQVTEGQVAAGRLARGEAGARAAALLREVDIADPVGRAGQYPHQFSGGMRQRAVIAMAMAGRPRLIIADEPTTALDVTVQAQILSVLARRQAETGAAVILITHDLGVVAEVAHRVAVMYGGRVVETGPVRDIFRNPRHPYTAALLNSIPRLDRADSRLDPIPGQPPMPAELPSGCAFEPRCALGRGQLVCRASDPPLEPQGPAQRAACHFAGEAAAPVRAAARAAEPRPEPTAEPLLIVDDLRVHYPIRAGVLRRTVGHVRAVDGVSLSVRPGETVSLVGESGCGKTTTGRAVMGLVKTAGGRILFDGQALGGLGPAGWRKARRHMQYIFQDPYSSLNPVKPVGEVVAEPLRIHGVYEALGGARYVAGLFERVGLSPRVMERYPREFSGGQKQRIGIARALALQPRLLILDEPVAALDVSIQAQIVNLLQDLQQDLGLAYLFIAHDLSVVRHISDRVAVMYLGRIVEEGPKDAIYERPMHPYTQSLLSAVPTPDPDARRHRIVLEGEIPNPASPPTGCTFHPRCFRADERCAREAPAFVPVPGEATRAACHYPGPLAGAPAGEATSLEAAS
ncbi:ABC transporter ATP-binding protein [Alsobacter sp. SYSU M60028]|uniref:ABC transporter ATP-binding protein n=1 Tax=Alsobacter ponti TaxID=2962936 RepID=A0ABT1LAD4_9HYPH|nr:ABC transporter ATP-binding protein [Alsobacter ponti]MCP8938452.1 ABC transporter ATP-binding protein [Alsobacter ponti]